MLQNYLSLCQVFAGIGFEGNPASGGNVEICHKYASGHVVQRDSVLKWFGWTLHTFNTKRKAVSWGYSVANQPWRHAVPRTSLLLIYV